MRIYRIAANKPGTSFYVSVNNLWSHRRKLEEVYNNISNGKTSMSVGMTPIVSKSLQIKNAFFIMDGHHRIIQEILDGKEPIYVEWNRHLPYLDAGIGNELPQGHMKVIDFIKEKLGNKG